MPSSGGDQTNRPQLGKFARLLAGHLTRGTRPQGQSSRSWGVKEFAQAAGVDDRSVRNWVNGRNLPNDIATIERLLFGDRRLDAAPANAERQALRNAFHDARSLGGRGWHRSLLPPRSNSFVGRATNLDDLHGILEQGARAAITQNGSRVSISGLGGIGKTSLAVEYAHRHGGQYSGVWWIAAQTRAGILVGLSELAEHVGAITAGSDVLAAAEMVLDVPKSLLNWLIIYDNVPDPNEIRDLLPKRGIRLLITSRFPDWTTLAMEVSLDVLSEAEAVDLLQSRALRKDLAGAAVLAKALGYLPLALDHAAATCRRAQIPFTTFADQVDELVAVLPRGSEYPQSVAATFDLAIQEAAKQSGEVENLMAFIGQCAPDPIPMELLIGACRNDRDRAEAVMALTDLSLLTHVQLDNGAPGVVAHRLVQAVARARSRQTGSDSAAFARLLIRLAEIYPTEGYQDPSCWPLCANLSPHILAHLHSAIAARSDSPNWPQLINRAASYFQGRALLSEAEPLRRQALALRESILGPNDPLTAMSLNDVALIHYERGEYDEALPLFARALDILEGPHSSRDPDEVLLRKQITATALNNQALCLQAAGRLDEAEPKYRRSLRLRRRFCGANAPETAQSLNNLGFFYLRVGRLIRAEPLLQLALQIRRGIAGGEANTAQTLNNLAVLLLRSGNAEGALPLSEEAVQLYGHSLGPDHPNTNRGTYNLARILLSLDRPSEALGYAKTALEPLCERLGAQHTWTSDVVSTLREIYQRLGRADDLSDLSDRFPE